MHIRVSAEVRSSDPGYDDEKTFSLVANERRIDEILKALKDELMKRVPKRAMLSFHVTVDELI